MHNTLNNKKRHRSPIVVPRPAAKNPPPLPKAELFRNIAPFVRTIDDDPTDAKPPPYPRAKFASNTALI